MVYKADIFGDSGQLFAKPIPKTEYGDDGLIATIQNLHADKFMFKHVAFNDKSDRFATGRQCRVRLFPACIVVTTACVCG
jgi:hypothetical protein